MTSEQQNVSLGETYPELAKRLDEGICLVMSGRALVQFYYLSHIGDQYCSAAV